ncbi:uncharacterized protein ANIA_10114 [Aspergillus nidulans FGSC A4]|uniref:Secreted protein n=1 Tax=Emericella nidulans (strain FGSC A4 / ATCC 38163 / CBS 112.46 / NRRL 194 / M139) TaxID=227321 RepID=C8VRQ9_EMENI|nr:hypothetical protein [Aspergillus nidulans FGSC A4]CBF88990.1 TPA: conserved hypothetical protein [Aspergillus nidulans FGSC A4]
MHQSTNSATLLLSLLPFIARWLLLMTQLASFGVRPYNKFRETCKARPFGGRLARSTINSSRKRCRTIRR